MLAANRLQVGIGVANVDDHGLDVLVVQIALAHRTLVALVLVTALVKVRQLGLDAVTDLDDGEVGRGLQHGTADKVTDAAGELLVDLLAGGVANDGVDLGLGVLGSDAARVLGGDVDLLELGEVALLVHGIVDRLQAVDVNLTGGAVDGHLGAPVKMQNLGIALGERLLQAVDQVELVDMPLLAKLHQGGHHVGCCILLSFLRGLEVIGGLQLALFNIREIEGDGLAVLELEGHVRLGRGGNLAGVLATALGGGGGELAVLAHKAGKVARDGAAGAPCPGSTPRAYSSKRWGRAPQSRRDPLRVGRDVVERQALTLGTLDTHAHAGGLGGTHELNVDDVDIVLGSDGLERIDNRLLGLGLDHCGTSIHTKKKRGRNPTSFIYNFICKQTIPIPANTCKHNANPQVSVPTASPQEYNN